MEFSLNGEEILLKQEARRFLEKECEIEFVKELVEDEKGFPSKIWKMMGELGWMGVSFDEAYRGDGGSFSDLTLLIEEMGRVLLPGPFFSSVVLAGKTIALSRDERIKEKLLPDILTGKVIMTLGLTETEGGYTIDEIESRAERKGDDYVLNGRKMFVPYAHIANYIIVPAKVSKADGSYGISLLVVDTRSEGVAIRSLVSLSLEKQCEVTFTDVKVPGTCVMGRDGNGWAVIRDLWPIAVTAKCCEMLGAMERVLELTKDHAQKRCQFGHPLAAIQAIQHLLADMAIEIECARIQTHEAVWRVSNGLPAEKEVAMAKAWCSDAGKKVTANAHQIHGAVGFTKEYALHLYSQYAKASELIFGDATFHKQVVAGEIDSGNTDVFDIAVRRLLLGQASGLTFT